MSLNELGALCYDRFSPQRVSSALRRAAERAPRLVNLFRGERLPPAALAEAERRASSRLSCYYEHLLTLVERTPWEHVNQLRASVTAQHRADRSFLARVYSLLAERMPMEEAACGRALFLQVDTRTFALLKEPTADAISESTFVYMCRDWMAAVFEASGEKQAVLAERLLRSNRLWQRERWSVQAADASDGMRSTSVTAEAVSEDTAEPVARGALGGGTFFNNIGIHMKPTDGWVDAFWGVQSGLRVPIDLPGAGGTLFLLLTSCTPDLFEDWGGDPERYVKETPAEEDAALASAFQEEFKSDLGPLSYAVALLRDQESQDGTLAEIAMSSLSHHFGREPPGAAAMAAARGLAEKLVEIEPATASACAPFLMRSVDLFEQLGSIADQLQETAALIDWRRILRAKSSALSGGGPGLLSPEVPVRDFVNKLESEAASKSSAILIDPELKAIDARTLNLHGYLLTSIATNLFQGNYVCARASLGLDGNRHALRVVAVYPRWNLSRANEQDFLLRPVPGQRSGSGFYLTAELLRRHKGSIEYYRVPMPEVGSETVGIIALILPLT